MAVDREFELPPRPLIGLLLRLLHQHHAQGVDAALRAAGFGDIRPGHANVFPFIPSEGINIGALATLAGVRKQTMAQHVEELELAGYVERRPNPRDRRAKLVVLTAKGQAVSPVARRAGGKVEQHWAQLIGADELEHLRSTLRELLLALRRPSP